MDSFVPTLGFGCRHAETRSMSMIERGSRVLARTADDTWVPLRATTGVTQGMDFPVVWLLEEDRWADAVARGLDTRPHALPWPADDVRPAKPDTGEPGRRTDDATAALTPSDDTREVTS